MTGLDPTIVAFDELGPVPMTIHHYPGRWKYLPTWAAYSERFSVVGARCGYTRNQAVMHLMFAIAVYLTIPEKLRRRRA